MYVQKNKGGSRSNLWVPKLWTKPDKDFGATKEDEGGSVASDDSQKPEWWFLEKKWFLIISSDDSLKNPLEWSQSWENTAVVPTPSWANSTYLGPQSCSTPGPCHATVLASPAINRGSNQLIHCKLRRGYRNIISLIHPIINAPILNAVQKKKTCQMGQNGQWPQQPISCSWKCALVHHCDEPYHREA